MVPSSILRKLVCAKYLTVPFFLDLETFSLEPKIQFDFISLCLNYTLAIFIISLQKSHLSCTIKMYKSPRTCTDIQYDYLKHLSKYALKIMVFEGGKPYPRKGRVPVNKKLEEWCYGGVSKDFFMQQSEAIHQYNSKMLNRLLLLLTIIFGLYIALTRGSDVFSTYYEAYIAYFVVLLLMLCIFKLKINKSIRFTKLYMLLFSCVMFSFVCITGTIYDTDARAILTIVYILVLPMLFVGSTHHTYAFLTAATCIFP